MRIFTSITSKLRFITELTGLIFNNFNLMTINKEKISQEKLMVQTIDRLNKRSRQKSGARVIQTALNLFYAEGFHSVGTNLICSEAKVNKLSGRHKML